MPYRKESFAVDEYYHLYSRGVEKRVIFIDKNDYKHFLRLMYLCNSSRSITLRDIGREFDREKTIVNIGVYSLMPNHFHILAREKIKGGISLFMRKLLTAYSMYFNKKYKRTGRLFESTFKSVYISNDRHLKYLYAYIHLNPAKIIDKNWKTNPTKSITKLLKYVFSYPYSSLQEYVDLSKLAHKRILDESAFPKYFSKPLDHSREFYDWLKIEDTP